MLLNIELTGANTVLVRLPKNIFLNRLHAYSTLFEKYGPF